MKRFLFFLLLAVPAIGISQTNFQKGYIVTNAKDTLKGYIDYREGLKTPSSFVFKTDLQSTPKRFSTADCIACHIDEMASYQRFLVDISLGSVDISTISSVVDTTSKRDTVFLEVLQTGPNVTLYSYVDQIKSRFYILDKGADIPSELVMQLYFKEGQSGRLITNQRYARQLFSLVKKYDKSTLVIERRLERLSYKEDELIKMTNLINGQQRMKSKFERVRWYAGLSLDMARTKFTGVHVLAAPDATSKISAAPMINAGVDLFINPVIRRLGFRFEVAFVKSKSEVTSPSGGNTFDQFSGIFTPSMLYHIYNADKIKVFVTGGLGLNYSKYSNMANYRYQKNILTGELRKFDQGPLELNSFHLTFPITAGVVLNKKIELLAGYSVPTTMTNYVYYGVERQRFRLGFNYLFGKH